MNVATSAGGAVATEMPPRIEVAIPSYNHARFVRQTLESIFAQTRPPERLLVIDDGSKDESPAVLERSLAECPFPCELIVRPNRGLCATLNEAFARTSGPFFAYLGSDDAWEPHFLETGLSLLTDAPSAVAAFGQAWLIDEHGAKIGCSSTAGRYFGGDMRLAFLGGESIPKSPTVFYRRSALERFSWNESSRLEDYEMYLKLAGLGPFAWTPDVVGSWRTHGKNVSANLAFMLESVLDAHDRIGPTLGVSREDLRRTRAALIFRAGSYYLDAGERLRAVPHFARGLRGAPNVAAVARQLLKLVSPRSVWCVARGASALSGTRPYPR